MASSPFTAYSPCQITGFFQIHDQPQELSKKGSTGAGVNIEEGVTTAVRVARSSRPRVSVYLNGRALENPRVSKAVFDEYTTSLEEIQNVKVFHRCKLPIGRGYGTSGAGAVSFSLALNKALGSPLTREQALGVAHNAEIKSRTGLGTVLSVSYGGLLVRLTPGAPGTARVRKLRLPKGLRVVSGTYGPIKTTAVLSRDAIRTRINSCGETLVTKLLRRPTSETFLRLSRGFAECLGLMTPRMRKAIRIVDSNSTSTSMLMLGQGIFSIVPLGDVPRLSRLMRSLRLSVVTSRVQNSGAVSL